MPGATRPARPVRWVAISRLVLRCVRAVRASNMGVRYNPLSTTILTPSIVTDVSAIGVANTILRSPGFEGAIA